MPYGREMDSYDLVISGCGLSAIFAAREALKNNMKVLIVEKSIDLSFPPSGSMFISSDTFNRYFAGYEKYIFGRFSMVTLKTHSFENDYLLEKGTEIISLDREKLLRHMAADISRQGAQIRIRSSMESATFSNGKFKAVVSVEGKREEIETRYIGLSDGNIKNGVLSHTQDCRTYEYRSTYERYISTRNLDSRFLIELSDSTYRIEASSGKNVEILHTAIESDENGRTVSRFNYNGLLHSCFPKVPEGYILLGNMYGTERILGNSVRDVIKLSIDSIRSCLNGNTGMEEIKDEWYKMNLEAKNPDLDPIDSIREKIPVGL